MAMLINSMEGIIPQCIHLFKSSHCTLEISCNFIYQLYFNQAEKMNETIFLPFYYSSSF